VTESPNPNIVDTDTLTGEMHPIRRAVVSVGSNLGDRRLNLQGAVDSLADTPEVWVTAVSPVYETTPVDCPPEAKDYLNAVVLLDTTLSAATLLDRALAIEAAYGRERDLEEQRNAPRTLDVDLIVVGDRTANDDRLVLPHPRAAERAFVLAPWHDLEPDAAIPGAGAVADLLDKTGRDGLARRDDIELSLQ
jgi:2-amino-4-hydroxy-6-hydroxymethyldihydropteridine diphosphokinase